MAVLPIPGSPLSSIGRLASSAESSRRHFRSTTEQASNQPRADENRRWAGTKMCPRSVLWKPHYYGAGRLADLHEISTDRYVPGDRAAHRRFPNVRVHTKCSR